MSEKSEGMTLEMDQDIAGIFLQTIKTIAESKDMTPEIMDDCLELVGDIQEIKDDVLTTTTIGSERALLNLSELIKSIIKDGEK